MLTLQALTYNAGHTQTGGNHWNNATGTMTPIQELDTMLNRIALFNSTAGKCAPMQVVKQPEHGRTSSGGFLMFSGVIEVKHWLKMG